MERLDTQLTEKQKAVLLSISRGEYPLLDEDIPWIRSNTANFSKELFQLTAQLDVLKSRRNELRSIVELHQSALSPIHRIPEDVLIKIFNLTIYHKSFNSLSQRSGIWGITRTCSRWRAISKSTPFLWSNIILAYPFSAKSVDTLQLHLARAANHPLRVSMVYDADVTESQDKVHDATILSILLNHSACWTHAEFEILPDLLQHLSAIRHAELGILEELYITVLRDDTFPIHEGGVLPFVPNPVQLSSLKRVVLDLDPFAYSTTLAPHLVTFGGPNLTHLSMHRISPGDIPVIALYPMLKEVLFALEDNFDADDLDAVGFVTHDSLQYLCINNTSALAVLVLPSLYALKLDLDSQLDLNNTELEYFVARSSCILDTFTLVTPFQITDGQQHTSEDVFLGLSQLPCLSRVKTFTMSLERFNGASMFRLLAPSSFPELRKLTLAFHAPVYANTLTSTWAENLLAIAKIRATPEPDFKFAPLKVLRICSDSPETIQCFQAIRLREELAKVSCLVSLQQKCLTDALEPEWNHWTGPFWFDVVQDWTPDELNAT